MQNYNIMVNSIFGQIKLAPFDKELIITDKIVHYKKGHFLYFLISSKGKFISERMFFAPFWGEFLSEFSL